MYKVLIKRVRQSAIRRTHLNKTCPIDPWAEIDESIYGDNYTSWWVFNANTFSSGREKEIMSETIEAEGPRSRTCWIWHVWKWRSECCLWTMFDVDSIISQYMNLSTWTIRYIFSCEERWKARGLFEKRWCESICCVSVLMGFSHGDIWNGHKLFECRMLRLKTMMMME